MGGILRPPVSVCEGDAFGGTRGPLDPVRESIGKAPPLGETNPPVFGAFQVFEDVFYPVEVS
jgi:hypothetical protein